MAETSDQRERARAAEQTRVAHKAAIQGVAERNAAAHQVAKKKREVLDQRKAELRRSFDR